MDQQTQTEIEAAAFRRLVEHLRSRNDVQNIDLMNLAGFCRNCCSKWYRAEAEQRGLPFTVIDDPSLALDVDEPADLIRLQEASPEPTPSRRKGR